MTAYGKYRQAIVTALTIIMLCVISLTGATFAIFTSNEGDGTIGINVSSGKVDVDIVNTAGDTLIGSYLEFDYEEGSDKVLFEPGATFYTKPFRVINKGSVPIKYRIYISDDESIDSKILLDSFEFWVTTDVSKKDAGEKIKSFEGELELNASSDSYYLVVRMNNSAGNGLIGKGYKGIGITVYAVQGNAKLDVQ
jgi:hypothetical protein